MFLLNWIGILASIGTHAEMHVKRKRGIIISNSIALVLCSANFLILALGNQTFAESLVGLVIFSFPILLNKLGKHLFSALYLCWAPPVLVMWLMILGMLDSEIVEVTTYDGLRYYLLAFSFLPYILLDWKNVSVFLLGILPVFVGIFFCDFILELAGVGYSQKGVNVNGYDLTPFRSTMAYMILSGSFLVFKLINERANKLNDNLISELESKNEIIKKQADSEVAQLNQQLYQNLEDLTRREFVLRMSQEIAKVGSWEYRLKEDRLFWSDEMYNIFGVDKNIDLTNPNLLVDLFGEASALIKEAYTNLFEFQRPYDFTLQANTPIGYKKWVRVSGFPLLEKDKFIGVSGIVHDITVYKESEELIKSSEQKYRSLFEQASDAILIMDFQGKLIDVNINACSRLGYSKPELLQLSIGQLIDSNQLRADPIRFDQLIRGEQVFTERIMICKDGSSVIVEANAKRISDNRIMAIARDVTSRKQMEVEREQTQQLLRARVKEITTLYRANQILSKGNRDLESVINDLLIVLPYGFHFSNPPGVSINVFDKVFTTQNFVKRELNHVVSLRLNERKVGVIEVSRDYLYGDFESPFSIEERELLNSVGEMLQLYLGRIKDEEARERSEANLRATINNTEILIWSVDRDFRLMMFNEPFFQYIRWRYKKDIKIGERVLHGIPVEDIAEVHKRWDHNYMRSLSGEVVVLEDYDLGQHFHYSLSPIIERGQITGISVFAEDITERKNIEEEVIRNRANLYATINNSDKMIWSIDPEFNLLTFNDPFRKFVKQQYGRDVKIGERIFLDGPVDEKEVGVIETWMSRYNRALSGESFSLVEDDNGEYFNISLNPMKDQNGNVIGASVFVEDITDRVLKESALAEANKKIGEMRLMALRSVMNPHFIFNALNSIQFFIAKNDRLNAINYLSTFSKLIRGVLTSSVHNKIKLSEEIELLRHYIDLELVRFEGKFDFKLDIDPNLDLDSIEIPSLLAQPYVENAILHGLYNKQSRGTLSISIYDKDEAVLFEIEDDGIGRDAAIKLRQQNFPKHKSMGIVLTEERLRLINEQNNISFEIEDLYRDGEACGTRVKIWIKF